MSYTYGHYLKQPRNKKDPKRNLKKTAKVHISKTPDAENGYNFSYGNTLYTKDGNQYKETGTKPSYGSSVKKT